jgi:GNAT superfamily N-acetyltransferase
MAGIELEILGEGVRIEQGWRAGAIGRVTEMHGLYYSRAHAFGPSFEAKVAGGLAEFSARLDHPDNGLWCAVQSGRIVGSIAIDGQDQTDGAAHLRYFIVEDTWHAQGLGRQLLRHAVNFADSRGFGVIRLWTFQGLDAARHLYEREGFRLVRSWVGDQWGRECLEQVFERGTAPQAASAPS